MNLNEKYLPLAHSKCRYFVVTGGRGSSKSFSVNAFATLLTYEKGHKILFSRYTMTSAHDSIIPEFIEKIEILEQEHNFYITNKDVLNRSTKSEILFRGIKTSSGDQTANLKSLQGVTTWIIDEAEEFVDESKFDDINLSVRDKTHQNRIIIILNPAYKSHWIYERFFERNGVTEGFNGEKNGVCYIHTTYLDNLQHLNKSFIMEAERTKKENPDKYNHVFVGKWKNQNEGVILTRWERGKFDDSLPYVFGLDWGWTDPFTLTKIAVDSKKKKLYIKQICYATEMSMVNIQRVISDNCSTDDLIVCDSSEPLNINQLRSEGFNAVAAYKKPGIVVQRLRWLQEYLLVLDDSPDVEFELNNYIWNDKRAEVPIDKYNHSIDGIGYAFTQIYLWGQV